jgi:hypothetical protein
MLAILKVNAERGRGHLDNYLPFIYHCLSRSGAEVASARDVQRDLKQEFGFEVPQGVLQQLFDRAVKDKKLRLENHAYRIEPGTLDDCDLGEEEGRVQRGLRELIFELKKFASDEFELNWDEAKAEQQLMRYVDGFSSKVLSAAVGGRDLPAPHELNEDDFVVHRFTSRIHDRHVDLFDRLVEVVKGRMLADALYYMPVSEPNLPSLEKVGIYFDGPLLLHVLGYAGAEIQAPYIELVDLLKQQGALLRCFEHCVAEAQEILDAAARKVRTGYTADRFHGDVVAHLIRTGASRAEIELLAERLPNDLLRMGIQPVETPERSVHLQPDEEKLAKQLQDRINYGNSRARDRDLDSLTAIHRLRRGRTFRDLPKCQAIFISHNYGVFRVSSRFFRTSGKSIPLCMYDSAFTTLVWLYEPHESPQLPRDRVLASAYAALNPKAELWQRFNEAIDRLRDSGQINDEDAHFLRFADEAREALMDHTRGSVDAFTLGSTAEILERSRDAARADIEADLAAERKAHSETEQRISASRERAGKIATSAGDWIANLAFASVALILVLGAIFGPVGPLKEIVPGAVQVICAGVALALGVTSVIASFSLLELRSNLAAALSRTFERTLMRFFKL